MVAYEFSTQVTPNRMLVIPTTTAPALHPGAQVRVILLVENHGQHNGHSSHEIDEQFGVNDLAEYPIVPADELAEQFHAALVEAGYDTEEKVLELVRTVRREIAIEQGLLPASHQTEADRK